ncbi:glycoside hydrolase family 28 protein [Pelagicoccus sp. SDUM812003]|uniref:glycoside hydrolase family 28 protein n=1 Tax=Pelagicoccus sp. SDUM812003 TaxID=3041267 RepID=UPI00280EC412|nr:glycoside hydrolase family 28 protein [Pelagicoccus sp. SDUM812003]MDQ8202228.1 glycoside hydrolase family 28 protein [Pelagicoccus sp. SDUM812003]
MLWKRPHPFAPSRVGAPAIFALLVFAAVAAIAQESPPADWKIADLIAETVELPRIPDRVVSIADFGAQQHPADARPAILAAIESVSGAGGGRVVLPAGKWYSEGPIHLKSRVEFHVSEGATLLFSGKPESYLPVVKTRWEGTELFTYSPLIYGRDVEDVAVTGRGTIDGNADSAFKAWHGMQDDDISKLRRMGFTGTPVEQRQFGEGSHLRPPAVQIFGGERVLLEDYRIVNSPFWINHLVYVTHGTVRGLEVESHFANNDGIDIESSSWVIVENCHFRTGDDSVVVKSGRDLDGRTIGIPSSYILVRDNDMGGEDGIGLGSEMSGGISHVYFTDNRLQSGSSAFRLKSNLDRGGLVEKIRIRNFEVGSFDTLFWFQLNYPSKQGGNFPSTYRDIVFENIQVEDVKVVMDIHAPDSAPLRDVLFKDISVASAETNFIIENAEGLRLENFAIGDQIIDGTFDWRKK